MQHVIRRTLLTGLLALAACASSADGNSGDDAGGGPGSGGDGAVTPSMDGGTRAGNDGGAGSDGATVPAEAGPGSGGDAAAVDAAGHPTDAATEAASDASTLGSTGPYGGDGPHTVTTSTFQVPSPNGTFTTTGYIPSGAGPFPVVILSSGFFQPATAYAPYANRLASWGILTFLRDDPNLGEATPNVASDVGYTVATWLAATNADSTSAIVGKVDASHVGLAGHSRGGQVALLAGEGGAKGKIQGVFGLDPVDTSMSGNPQARTTLATIGVPVAFIGETTDSAASGCAPGTDNYQVLYQAAASPAVAITAVNADHTMFEDPATCFACTACTAGTASQPQVLAAAVRYLTAFFARQLLGDTTVGASFDGAGANQDIAAGLVTLVSK